MRETRASIQQAMVREATQRTRKAQFDARQTAVHVGWEAVKATMAKVRAKREAMDALLQGRSDSSVGGVPPAAGSQTEAGGDGGVPPAEQAAEDDADEVAEGQSAGAGGGKKQRRKHGGKNKGR